MTITDAAPLRWGILGLGKIARTFATQLPSSTTGQLVVVASRERARAEGFAREFGVRSSSFEELLADPEVDAVYVATENTAHVEWTIRALEAGKHVLAEKPLAVNHAGAMSTVEAALRADRVLVEAYMYRLHPQLLRLLELVRAGRLGDIHHVCASFGFRIPPDPAHRVFDPWRAGGGILDLGCYPVSAARTIAAAAGLRGDAIVRNPAGHLSAGIDDWASADLEFVGGMTAHVSAGLAVRSENALRVYGSAGQAHLPDPWLAPAEGPAALILDVADAEREELTFDPVPVYALEADAFAATVRDRADPADRHREILGQAKILDAWRDGIGLVFPFEALGHPIPTATGRPLARRESAMTYGRVPGVDKDISRLVMGCAFLPVARRTNFPHASALFDDFIERGGTAFDTAHVYQTEDVLGRWIANRGIRDEVVAIGKGAHQPNCDPESIGRELEESLDRFGFDSFDLYFMHHDNEEIPVEEFVDALDEQARLGRMTAYGVSNWTIDRFAAANDYAARSGRRPLRALSDHFGLARVSELPWAGGRHVTDQRSKDWLAGSGVPLFPWSSQSRGFIARADPADRSDAELVRCYYSDDNFERQRRVRDLASRLGVDPMAVALAYVLCQPFPTFALIGPLALAETRTSMAALDVALSPDQVAWLDLADDASVR